MNPFMRHNENGSVLLALVTPWGAGMPNRLRIMPNIFEKQRWKIFTQGPQEHMSEIQFSALNAFCSQKSSNYKILLWQLASFPFQIANSHLVLCYYGKLLAFRGQWQTWAELCIKDDFLFVTDVFIRFFFGNFFSAIHWVFFLTIILVASPELLHVKSHATMAHLAHDWCWPLASWGLTQSTDNTATTGSLTELCSACKEWITINKEKENTPVTHWPHFSL